MPAARSKHRTLHHIEPKLDKSHRAFEIIDMVQHSSSTLPAYTSKNGLSTSGGDGPVDVKGRVGR